MKTRINNKEQEIEVSQATTEGLSDEVTYSVVTYTDDRGHEVTKHLYTVYGETISSNMEISEFELGQIKKTLKSKI